MTIMVCMAFLVVATVLLVLGEKHIEEMLTFLPSQEEESVDKDGIAKAGQWKKRCVEISDAYGLSPRESEVFQLLAKGRTIEYISDECHISPNTAKAHVRHIYVKLGIHTRQELLDLIEEF